MTGEGASGYIPAGYTGCRHCGQWIVGSTPTGLCPVCLGNGLGHLELVRESVRPIPKRATRGRKARKLTPEAKERKRQWNRARSRALMRLSRIYHPMYETLLAEELAAAGLDPKLDQRAPGSGATERAIIRSAVGE